MVVEFDLAIIGAGCVGAAIAQRLCKYNLKIALLDKDSDVSMGASKANSGIIHTGYFTAFGSNKEKYNILGAPMFEDVCETIGVELSRPGAVFCAINEEQKTVLKDEFELDQKRGIPVEYIENNEKIHELEPELGKNITAILHFPTVGMIVPFELVVGLAEHAIMNGVKLFLNYEVSNIEKQQDGFTIIAADGKQITTKTIINAAGTFSDKIANMVGINTFKIIPRRGEYILLDKGAIPLKKVVFPTPTKNGKGILVSPTLHGNIFIGPNAHEINGKEDKSTTTMGLNEIIAGSNSLIPKIPLRLAITNFAGVRATADVHDFIVGASEVPQFLNAAGIESPGLSSCLAIAEGIETSLKEVCGYNFTPKMDYIPKRTKQIRFKDLSVADLAIKIKENPQWGNVVCRCETVTEAEIVEICHSPIPANNTDMVKRRLRPGMGRCQGGFCLPKVMKIISREQKMILSDITKTGDGSQIVLSRTKQLPNEIIKEKQL